MIKILITLILLFNFAIAKNITPNEVYSQVRLIQENVHNLHKHFGMVHDHEDEGDAQHQIKTKLKPRNSWQKTYEILVKINMLREENNLPIIEPVNMTPELNLDPNLVYEMTQRILAELDIFHYRLDIKKKRKHEKKKNLSSS